MSESIVATIEYDKDQDDVEKVIDLDPSISWNDFKMIVSCFLIKKSRKYDFELEFQLACFLSCENFRIYYQDDEGDQVNCAIEFNQI